MQLLVYIIVYPILWMISILPMRLLYAFSDFIYVLIYHIIGYRKKTVQENLRLVFPEKPEKEINTITKKFYHHLCDIILEAIKSITISEKELKKRFVPTNVEVIQDIAAANKSIALMLSHYGNWEWIFILQRQFPHKTYGIYKRIQNKYFDAMVKRVRAKYNSFLITTKEAIPVLNAAKEKGEITLNGFISDQSPKHYSAFHWNEFMNIRVPVYTGAEFMAKKLDMAVVFCKINKVKRGFYEATFETITLTPNDYKDYEITDIFLKLTEAQIYEAPQYYLWTHKRWKHRDKVPEAFQITPNEIEATL